MKKEVREVAVPAQIMSQVVWIASDGKEFNQEHSCRYHERALHITEMWKKVKLSAFQSSVLGVFYFITDQETLDFLVSNYTGNWSMTEAGKKLKVGDWVHCDFREDDRNNDEYTIITMSELIETVEKFQGEIK